MLKKRQNWRLCHAFCFMFFNELNYQLNITNKDAWMLDFIYHMTLQLHVLYNYIFGTQMLRVFAINMRLSYRLKKKLFCYFIICFIETNLYILTFCLCIFESATVKSDCSMQKNMNYLKI